MNNSMYSKILEAIEKYNRYHSPEAVARVVEFRDNIIEVIFEGVFCRSCGVVDWVEDLVYILRDMNFNASLFSIQETENGLYAVIMLKKT